MDRTTQPLAIASPDEVVHRLQRFMRALEAKYQEYKAREAAYLARAAMLPQQEAADAERCKALREMHKAHGCGVAIQMLRLHLVVPADVDIPLPDTRAGDLT